MSLSKQTNRQKMIEIKPITQIIPPNIPTVVEEDDVLKASNEEIILEQKALLANLKKEQEMLIQDTESEIESLKAAWVEEKEVLQKEAHEEGFNAGFIEGKNESIEQYKNLIDKGNEIVTASTKDYHDTLERSEEELMRLSIRITEKILQQKLSDDPSLFLNIVKSAIKEIKDQSIVYIYVHPNQYDLLLQEKDELYSLIDQDHKLKIYMDQDLNEQDCVIEHSFGKIEASVDVQLEQIRNALVDIAQESRK